MGVIDRPVFQQIGLMALRAGGGSAAPGYANVNVPGHHWLIHRHEADAPLCARLYLGGMN